MVGYIYVIVNMLDYIYIPDKAEVVQHHLSPLDPPLLGRQGYIEIYRCMNAQYNAG